MWYKNKPIAHRGFHGSDAPENSLAAFQIAVEKGYAIETDIQLLADGTVVVFHDGDLKRMCDADKNLWQITLPELAAYTLAGTTEKIPTLGKFLDLTGGRVPLLIELKLYGDTSIPALCQAAAKILENYKGEFAVQAFHPYIIKWFCDNRPDWHRGQLACYFEKEKTMPLYQKIALKRMIFNRRTKPHFVSYDAKHINSRFVRREKRRGRAVLAWTVRAGDNVAEIKKYADNIIFEGFEA